MESLDTNKVVRYIVVGAGGTGTHLLPALIAYLNNHHEPEEFQLGVIDGDSVEPKNLERQLFHPATVNDNKARAALANYRQDNFKAIPEYLSPENIGRYLIDGCIVFITADNFPVRALIEDHCLTLENSVVINLGNEVNTGSAQIWIRRNGENITPPISFMHPEIRNPGLDRSALSCAQVAELPGGEQTIVANMSAAMYGLLSLMNLHSDKVAVTEIQFDLESNKYLAYGMDMRRHIGWQ